MDPSLQQLWELVCEEEATNGFDALPIPKQTWVTTRVLIDMTNNGGLVSYYYNSGADQVHDCLKGLNRLGASEVAACVSDANPIFPSEIDITDFEARNHVINSWEDGDDPEQRFEKLDDRMFALIDDLETGLDAYLAREGVFA